MRLCDKVVVETGDGMYDHLVSNWDFVLLDLLAVKPAENSESLVLKSYKLLESD